MYNTMVINYEVKSKESGMWESLLALHAKQNTTKINKYFINQNSVIMKQFLKLDMTTSKEDLLKQFDKLNWTSEEKKLADLLIPIYKQSYKSGAHFMKASILGKVSNLTPVQLNKNANKYIKKVTASKVKNITQTTKSQLSSVIKAGLEAGETTKELAKNINNVMVTASTSRAVMIAQTETHNAICAGSYETAKESGLNIKIWNTVNDEAVRETHKPLNNQIVEINKPFKTKLGPMMYPGDINGSPGNVIRCRCFLTYDYDSELDIETPVNEKPIKIKKPIETVRRKPKIPIIKYTGKQKAVRVEMVNDVTSNKIPYESRLMLDGVEDVKERFYTYDIQYANIESKADNITKFNNLVENNWNKLTPDQQEVVFKYTTSKFSSANQYLRGVERTLFDFSKRQLDMMEDIFSLNRAKENTILFRGQRKSTFMRLFDLTESDYEKEDLLRSKLLNTKFTDHGVISTTVRKERADDFSGDHGVIFKINQKKGTKQVAVGKNSAFQSEMEVLLENGTTFRIVKIDKVRGRYERIKVLIELDIVENDKVIEVIKELKSILYKYIAKELKNQIIIRQVFQVVKEI